MTNDWHCLSGAYALPESSRSARSQLDLVAGDRLLSIFSIGKAHCSWGIRWVEKICTDEGYRNSSTFKEAELDYVLLRFCGWFPYAISMEMAGNLCACGVCTHARLLNLVISQQKIYVELVLCVIWYQCLNNDKENSYPAKRRIWEVQCKGKTLFLLSVSHSWESWWPRASYKI